MKNLILGVAAVLAGAVPAFAQVQHSSDLESIESELSQTMESKFAEVARKLEERAEGRVAKALEKRAGKSIDAGVEKKKPASPLPGCGDDGVGSLSPVDASELETINAALVEQGLGKIRGKTASPANGGSAPGPKPHLTRQPATAKPSTAGPKAPPAPEASRPAGPGVVAHISLEKCRSTLADGAVVTGGSYELQRLDEQGNIVDAVRFSAGERHYLFTRGLADPELVEGLRRILGLSAEPEQTQG